ncbi:MAG: hypothetical protein RQ745_13895, partial [Longimicrobiales bacterium]|nr:hypothetical protein [Longimicrobiales bacterium]
MRGLARRGAAGGRRTPGARFTLVVVLAGTVVAAGACGAEAPAPGEASRETRVRTDPFRVAADFDGATMTLTPCGNPDEDVRVVPGPESLDLAALHEDLDRLPYVQTAD